MSPSHVVWISGASSGIGAAAMLRVAADRGELASAQSTAEQIWQLVLDGTHGEAVPVGAVPAGVGR